MNYPIKIRLSPSLVDELACCELGSFEDNEYAESNGGIADRPTATHTYTICQRHKGLLEVRNAEEADDLYSAVCSGSFQIIEEDYGKSSAGYRAAVRIANVLRPYARPETVARWRGPSGN